MTVVARGTWQLAPTFMSTAVAGKILKRLYFSENKKMEKILALHRQGWAANSTKPTNARS
jgi:hypothetical protein